ncbi:MAG: flagellin lysine-N-methylase [Lachnospiraceae bacterium]|nr:flagellin lysine-N-methylase [Lachnospiraceae bacterium]
MQREIKPDYYDSFSCIADKCSFTCCQEWKIAVDDETNKKWEKLNLSKATAFKEGCRVVQLNKYKKCPFLDDNRLCKLVSRYGDEVLSKTCAVFPRQLHTYETEERKEYSLVSCCPAVVDIWNEKENIEFIGESQEKGKEGEESALFQIRGFIMNMLQEPDFSIPKTLMMLFYIICGINKETMEKGTRNKEAFKKEILYKESQIREVIKKYTEAATIQELSDTIDAMKFSALDTFDEGNELFLDLVENYRKEGLYTKYLEEIAVLAEEFADGYDMNTMEKQLAEFEREFSFYEKLFRNYLVAEFFTNSVLPNSDVEGLVVMFQWIAMEYTTMKHAIFLRWISEGKTKLDYLMVRDYIIVVSRMTGYEQEDIYEYLENSFQNLLWDWGYLALIVGMN